MNMEEAFQFFLATKVNVSDFDKFDISKDIMNDLSIYLNKKDDDYLLEAFSENFTLFSLIDHSNRSDFFIKKAITNEGSASIVIYLTNPSEELWTLAISQKPSLISSVPEQTIDLCLLAMGANLQKRTLGHFFSYEKIKIVPNPDYETTLKNLLEKKALLESFK